MSTYQTGNGTGQISLKVNISVEAAASSKAILTDLTSPKPGKEVAHSNDANGDIDTTNIGQGAAVAGSRLSTFTELELWGNTVEERKAQYENLSATYTLDGGASGKQTYANPIKTVDDEYTIALLHKPIDLI
jgi:hypothetical protein